MKGLAAEREVLPMALARVVYRQRQVKAGLESGKTYLNKEPAPPGQGGAYGLSMLDVFGMSGRLTAFKVFGAKAIVSVEDATRFAVIELAGDAVNGVAPGDPVELRPRGHERYRHPETGKEYLRKLEGFVMFKVDARERNHERGFAREMGDDDFR